MRQTTIPQTINKKKFIIIDNPELETEILETNTKLKVFKEEEEPNTKLKVFKEEEEPNTKLETFKEEEPNTKLGTTKEEEGQKEAKPCFGIIFEMAICILFMIAYDGIFNKLYLPDAYSLMKKIVNLTKLVEGNNYIHTASRGARYDFTCGNMHLSVKTNTSQYKICPQVVGQPSLNKFCTTFCNGKMLTHEQIKEFIQMKKNIPHLMKTYFEHTFDCPVVYYHKKTNDALFIKTKDEIDWTKYTYLFTHTKNKRKNYTWHRSSSIQLNGITIGEFQTHNNRDNIKFRWDLRNLVKQLPEYFVITNIQTLKPFTF
jgi:hypothetical protein